MRVAPVKTAATAASNYGTNAGSVAAANNWATNMSADLPAILTQARNAVGLWQAGVSTAAAATAYQNGLTAVINNPGPTITKIQGPAKTTYTAQVKAAAAAGGKYNSFAAAWMPAVATEIATLDRTNPSGDFAANLARMTAFIDWAHNQKGKFKQ